MSTMAIRFDDKTVSNRQPMVSNMVSNRQPWSDPPKVDHANVDPPKVDDVNAKPKRKGNRQETPTAVLVRQVLRAVAEFEKTTLVAKLAAARRRKRKATGKKVEGRKSHAEKRPEIVALAKALARKRPKGGKMSLRAVAAEMAARGYLNERGKTFNPKSISTLLAS
jgi:hypothetical protein